MIAKRLRHARNRPIHAAGVGAQRQPRLRQPLLPLVDIAVHAPRRAGMIGPHQAIQSGNMILGAAGAPGSGGRSRAAPAR